VATTRRTLDGRPEVVGRLRRALTEGYREAYHRPAATVAHLRATDPGLDAALMRAEVDALHTAFAPVGRLDRRTLSAWAAWDVRFGILERRPNLDRAFDLG
jgi:hypothetical protein